MLENENHTPQQHRTISKEVREADVLMAERSMNNFPGNLKKTVEFKSLKKKHILKLEWYCFIHS